MAPARKISEFHRDGNEWFSDASLPSNITLVVDGMNFHLHKARPWLSDTEREHLCSIIDFQKLSIDACFHASQRLPLRVVLQVLFFEQLQLRTAIADSHHFLNAQDAAASASGTALIETAGQKVRRDGRTTVGRENEVIKSDMARITRRVGELEEKFTKIKEEMKKVAKSRSHLMSPRFLARGLGCE